ncbi:hypothetical protein [Robbsia andropogonis]|uniref:hypothetical protein n=1 Tax=Robbsia andropogonis TaxID=28092 RepID=UPI00209CD6B0|nr:hypothetical protein [Robbsia andropogonis]MCP1116728.1 hypothetical protein [Robbsia andropogonis]MCP1126593.1 hypothetical protein [Robbsia andropogonis]
MADTETAGNAVCALVFVAVAESILSCAFATPAAPNAIGIDNKNNACRMAEADLVRTGLTCRFESIAAMRFRVIVRSEGGKIAPQDLWRLKKKTSFPRQGDGKQIAK